MSLCCYTVSLSHVSAIPPVGVKTASWKAKRAWLPQLPKFFSSPHLHIHLLHLFKNPRIHTETSKSSSFITSITFATVEMDPYDLNVPPSLLDSVCPVGDFLYDEPSESPSASTAPTTFRPSIGGQYHLNGASLFDSEYIDPAMLEGSDNSAMGNLVNDYAFPAMQDTHDELSPYHPEWQSPATDFEQQQNFQAQQGVSSPGVGFPNALDTSTQGDASFDWPGTQQGVHGSTGSLAFSQGEHFG